MMIRLTEEECMVALTDLQYRAQSGEDIRWDKVSEVIKQAQLKKLVEWIEEQSKYNLSAISQLDLFNSPMWQSLKEEAGLKGE